jgi:hypothetical protein
VAEAGGENVTHRSGAGSPNSELDATVAPYKAQSFRLFRLVSL